MLAGLSISPYFSATKLLWLKMHVPAVQEAILSKRCLVGTIDTWVIWVSSILANTCIM